MKTDKMTYNEDNIARDIIRRGAETPPGQQDREIVVNAIQACERKLNDPLYGYERDEKPTVEIDYNKEIFNKTGVYKLQVSDNGQGFPDHTAVRNTIKMNSSGNDPDLIKNFGIGAKITAVLQNTFGVNYLTRHKNGFNLGWTIHWPDLNKEPCIKPHEDDENGYYTPSADEMPPLIKNGGTSLTLMGNSEYEDTFIKTSNKHIYKYLTTKFWDWDSRIKICVNHPDDLANRKFHKRELISLKDRLYNEEFCEHRETIELSMAKVHIIVSKEDRGNQSDLFPCNGFTCSIYKQGEIVEIYEPKEGSSHGSFLRGCRIPTLHKRITMVIEWKIPVFPNSSRTSLLVSINDGRNGNPLPIEKLQEEIGKNIPPYIQNIINSELSSYPVSNLSDYLRKFAEECNLNKFSSYSSYDKDISSSAKTKVSGLSQDRNNTNRSSSNGKNSTNTIPNLSTRWGENEFNKDRVASYDDTNSIIWLNPNYLRFIDLVDIVTGIYSNDDSDGKINVISQTCREMSARVVARAIIATKSHNPKDGWSLEDKSSAWDENSLTMLFDSSFLDIINYCKQSLKGKFVMSEEKLPTPPVESVDKFENNSIFEMQNS